VFHIYATFSEYFFDRCHGLIHTLVIIDG